MKTINVVAAIIKQVSPEDGVARFFATQRGYGPMRGGWEFPGGKIEPGELPEEALVREIREELDAEVEVGPWLETVEYDYPDFHLSMQCFICRLRSEHMVLREHEAARWLAAEELDEVDWLPADVTIVDRLKREMQFNVRM